MYLWLIRHAKSSWADPGQADHARPLNKRGLRDGPRMARWLAQQAQPAQWMWCSDAQRAQETARFVAEGFGLAAAAVALEPSLYHASPNAMLDVLRGTPPHVRSVAVVAHNPGLTYLVNELAQRAVIDNLPTFGVAGFRLPDAWESWHELRLAAEPIPPEILATPKTI